MLYQHQTYSDENSSEDDFQGSSTPSLVTKLTRTQSYRTVLTESTLRRSLSTTDLSLLGVGTILGIGIYVMTAKLTRDTAGPAVILSILLASASALLSGICYAEFSSRVSRYGSAYVYCYTTLGEIWAFVVGWTMILEYCIVGAILARTCSEYVDFIFKGEIYNLFKEKVATWNYPLLGPFPDFLALFLVITVSVFVCFGMHYVVIFNGALLLFSSIALVLLFVIGLFLVRPDNWLHKFAPYGVQGVIRAAGSGYYAFIGVDVMAAASGEATNPQSSVPLSIILTVTMTTILYCGVASVITLVTPYDQLSSLAPLANLFEAISGAQYVAAVGAVTCCSSGLVSCLVAGPRVLFSMANDGLLFMFCGGCDSDSTRAIEKSALVICLLSGSLATLFATEHLIDLLSIGTLFAYTMVAISVLSSRYQPGVESVSYCGKEAKLERTDQWLQSVSKEKEIYPNTSLFSLPPEQLKTVSGKQNKGKEPSKTTGSYASFVVFLLVVSLSSLAITLTVVLEALLSGEGWAFLCGGISGLFIVVSVMFLARQPMNCATFPVMVPCFPWLPIVTIFINILLISELNHWTFVRFGAWLVPGLLIYGLYGYRRSTEAIKPKRSTDQDFIKYEKPGVDTLVKEIQPKAKQRKS